jgi:NAD(P)-dependent dehydrogenase (short-subunit alcohol dehydrogenase family)
VADIAPNEQEYSVPDRTNNSDIPTVAQLFDLTGKVIVVTGGSRGLGREMVRAFAAQGADVVIVSRKIESCQELAREIEARTGGKAMAYGCHVGRWDQLDGLVDAVYERFGRVDVLVNNAGMSPLYEKLEDVSEKLFDSVLGVNLKGPFRLAVLVGSRMVKGDGGVIINVSSTGSIRNHPSIVPYAAAKSGLNSITEGLAQAFGPKVRVNTLMSGPFLTDIATHWELEANWDAQRQSSVLQRIAHPAEVIGAALFLASDASCYTSGVHLRVDGGIK